MVSCGRARTTTGHLCTAVLLAGAETLTLHNSKCSRCGSKSTTAVSSRGRTCRSVLRRPNPLRNRRRIRRRMCSLAVRNLRKLSREVMGRTTRG
ncbi:hypothetical protein PHLGIDRAFT_278854 [Phlebiopsis gigantea 11061_1 CR5-6]|uniref:Secreted protein n=1 Tax=Phlebiopsis gigantea (strain 11061_1 CR5-6) TaxID=745531 RepID=A0A0C3PCF7_PHLG1|nr:hypothetical protein PHLGIDRAFT_278854 [Phlebiopsis gigantea 11061_1 CR5-6]